MPTDAEREELRNRVKYWADRLQATPRVVRIQSMTRKWGSCSSSGLITLASELADQDPGFRDFVIVHELLHLRMPSHGRHFKALMSAHLPDWRTHDMSREDPAGSYAVSSGG